MTAVRTALASAGLPLALMVGGCGTSVETTTTGVSTTAAAPTGGPTTGAVTDGSAPTGQGSTDGQTSPPSAGPDAPAEEHIARAIFERVNAEREARGLRPLSWSEELATVARGWSAEMADRGELVHSDLGEVIRQEVSGFRALGENIFRATGPVPAGTIHVGWMRSDEHRVNVLNPGFDRIGIGIVCADDGSVWATQEFGRTAGADRPALATTTPPQQPIARPSETGPSCG